MRQVIRSAALSAICVLSVAAKKEEAAIDPGPRPEIGEFRQKAEQAVLAGFFDPSSAQFDWNHGIVGGYFKPVLQRKQQGWWTCGLVNGKNRMGGYVGFRSFVVVMNNGAITYAATSTGGNYDFIDIQCQQAVAKGILPPPETAAAAVTTSPIVLGLAPALGFTYRNDGDTIAVNEVSTGGIAAAASLAPFMVIEKVNGLSLAGLPADTRAKLLDNAGAGTTLTVRGRGDMKMERPAPPAATAPATRPPARRHGTR